jgi:hypothetical protein
MIDHLPSTRKALSSNPSTRGKKEKEKEKEPHFLIQHGSHWDLESFLDIPFLVHLPISF